MLPPDQQLKKITTNLGKKIKSTSDEDRRDFASAVKFEKEYLNTPKFKERATKAGYDPDEYRKEQIKKLNNLKLVTDDSSKNKSGLYYREKTLYGIPTGNVIAVPSNKNRQANPNLPKGISPMSHEVGHSFNNDKLEEFINERNIYYPKTDKEKAKINQLRKDNPDFYSKTIEGHELEAVETVADVHAVRRELYDYTKAKGRTFDARSSNMGNKQYNDIKDIAKNPSSASYLLLNKIQSVLTDEERKKLPNGKGVDTDAKQEAYDKIWDDAFEKKEKKSKKDVIDVMNRVVSNQKATPIQYMANGGILDSRVGSRKRHIAPLVIGAISGALSLIGGISASAKAKQAKADAKAASIKQEQDTLNASRFQQAQADNELLANYDVEGQEGVQYYKKGGKINPKLAKNQAIDQMSLAKSYSAQGGGLKPNLPVSNGGYQTKGGNLIPIGDGVELAVGNRHNDTKIDGVSGIQLSEDGKPVAEIEHKEVVADGNVVYSDRLKYDNKKSYADMMIGLTKKRNKLESQQADAPNKAKRNSLDRQLAGLNMAEETLFKTQELHKEMEGKQVLNNIFAVGGRVSPGRPLPVPKWMQTFYTNQKGGKYNGYGVNGLGDFRDPNNPDVIIDQNNMPKYPYDTNTYKPKMIAAPLDRSAGMSDGSGELISGITNAATTVVGSLGTDANKNTVGDTTVTTPTSVANPSVKNPQNKTGIDWTKVAGIAGSLGPKLIDNLVNRAQTRNAPELPTMLNSVATPLETRVNINPALADARRRTATLRKSVLDNSSNSNNAKSNMVATSLASGRQIDELLVGKENQEMALRNANSQNRQAVANSNIAQINERSMMEFSRQNDLNTQRSANAANLVGDITSTINEFKVGQQFDADMQANLMDDPLGSKSILFAQNPEFMNSKTNRDFMFRLARTKKNPLLVKYLQDNYNYTE